MSRISEWSSEKQVCTVCGREFLPILVKHLLDMRHPTCSVTCQKEYDILMESIADFSKTYDYDELWDSFKEQ